MAKKHLEMMQVIINLFAMTGRGWLNKSPNGRFQAANGKAWITVGVPGQSDLCGYEIIDGIPVACFIEVKTIQDSIKSDQKAFLEARAAQGCKVYVLKPNVKGQLMLRPYPYQNGDKGELLI